MIGRLLTNATICDSVAEMAGGWGNYIMQDQPSFTVLDSFMMLINVYLLACFPPGILFPRMGKVGKSSKREKSQDAEQGATKSDEESKETAAAKLES